MKPANRLIAIKVIHTVIWAIFVSVIFYILYAGLFNKTSVLTWVGIGLILGEGFVLLLFKTSCPLTLLARKYSDSPKDNFDIFLPNWLAKHNKRIFTTLFLIGCLLVMLRAFF